MTDTWTNRFGTITALTLSKTRTGQPYVQGTLQAGGGATPTFDVPFVSFAAEVIAHLLSLGVGQRADLRGVIETRSIERGTYTERVTAFKAVLVNTRRAAASVPSNAPALPALR